jgi:AbrB family looped-hinge helix DNA binding protein
MVALLASGYITIPAALRRRCGLAAGDKVLLAALPDRGSLAAYSLAVVDQAIRAHGSFQYVLGGRP